MTADVEPVVFAPGVAHQVAAMLTVFAVEGHAPALRTLAVRFLTGDPVTADDLEPLSDVNLSLASLAVQQHAPGMIPAWRALVAAVDGL